MKRSDFGETQSPCRTAESATLPHRTLASPSFGPSLLCLWAQLVHHSSQFIPLFFTPFCPCSFLSCAEFVVSCLWGFIPHGQMNSFVPARWLWHLHPHPLPPITASPARRAGHSFQRVPEQFVLGGTLKLTLFQSPAMGIGIHHPLD